MSWLSENLLAIDQQGNALCGGRAINTVSARVGFLAGAAGYKRAAGIPLRSQDHYWQAVEALIDWGFEPLDGEAHCSQAYLKQCARLEDEAERFEKGSDLARAVLVIFAILVCVPLGLVLRMAGVEPEVAGAD